MLVYNVTYGGEGMGWFDEQIKQRIKNDEEAFSTSFEKMAQMISGTSFGKDGRDSFLLSKDAIEEILRFYHIKPKEIPESVKDINEQLEYLLRPFGIMWREIYLKDQWYQDAIGPILGRTKEGETIALLPRKLGGYYYFDYKNGKKVCITAKNVSQLDKEAIYFYKPFPLKALGINDFFQYLMGMLTTSDFMAVAFLSLLLVFLGMLTPVVNNILFSQVIYSGEAAFLLAVISLLAGAAVCIFLITIVKNMVLCRIKTKLHISVESAAVMRCLSLPVRFFKKYGAGNIGQRVQGIAQISDFLVDAIFSIGVAILCSLIYFVQIFSYTPQLASLAVLLTILQIVVIGAGILVKMKLSLPQMEEAAKERGMMFAMLSGIQKIKLTGAERRAFSKWSKQYLNTAKYIYTPPLTVKLNRVFLLAVTSIGTLLFYYIAIRTKVDMADYMAFHVAYGMVSAALTALLPATAGLAVIRPLMQMAAPLLSTMPEIAEHKKVVTRLSGGIELNNVSFRYKEEMPLIFDNLSLKVRPGQYVAIVGKTGCGKSTLMRLLLGFEAPLKGAVYYDGVDMSTMDLKSLRRHMGVVIQDGKLFAGDIFSNIVISAPGATLEEAWEAAEMAGVAEDIRKMPMGMHTLISEGSGQISGGQRQRLLIARAIIGKPRILLFDEATSALDNITQKIVSDSLAKLKCTRIVIAHRLSTIQECNRILMLENGRIIEDGSYEQLLKQKGHFAEMVERQRVNI